MDHGLGRSVPSFSRFALVFVTATLLALTALGGTASAVAECDGLPATIEGSGRIVGTPGDDVIVGSDGVDFISGEAGDDVICARDGRDIVVGDTVSLGDTNVSGRDRLFGEGGGDELIGDSWGGADPTTFMTGNSASVSVTGAAPDVLDGGTGEFDTIVGDGVASAEDSDTDVVGIVTGAAPDTIRADEHLWSVTGDGWVLACVCAGQGRAEATVVGAAPDSITGTPGSDGSALFSGHQRNALIGDGRALAFSSGDDAIATTTHAARDSIAGGGGDDAIIGDAWLEASVYGGSEGDAAARAEAAAADQTLRGDAGNDDIVADNYALGFQYDDVGGEAVHTASADDAAQGSGGSDEIAADNVHYQGSNAAQVGYGADTIAGGSGNDTLWGAGGPDILKGNSGRDTLDGGRGFDRCDGGTGTDSAKDCERTSEVP